MMPVTRSSATTTTLFISIPEGRLVGGRVKEVFGIETFPDQAHPRRPHKWRDMTHDGETGTGFVQCICGAVGIPFRKSRRGTQHD